MTDIEPIISRYGSNKRERLVIDQSLTAYRDQLRTYVEAIREQMRAYSDEPMVDYALDAVSRLLQENQSESIPNP
jgi:hypothetical protein